MLRKLVREAQKHLEQIEFCRTQFAPYAAPPAELSLDRRPEVDTGLGLHLLPAGCRSLEEVMERLDQEVTLQELVEFDGDLQSVIKRKFTSLLQVCMSTSTRFQELDEILRIEAEEYVQQRLGGDNAAAIYFRQFATEELMIENIQTVYQESMPDLLGGRGARQLEIRLLASPSGELGDRFRALVKRALPEVEFVAANDPHNIVFYREHPRVRLADLPQVGPQPRELYEQIAAVQRSSVHSRIDIPVWREIERG
jgi:hypothetical protein